MPIKFSFIMILPRIESDMNFRGCIFTALRAVNQTIVDTRYNYDVDDINMKLSSW